MKVAMTEYLAIDLEREVWECRRCGHVIHSARENYKEGLLVYDRDPREIHKPLLDPQMYERTFAPHPDWCAHPGVLLPFVRDHGGNRIYGSGHPPLHDMDFDTALK